MPTPRHISEVVQAVQSAPATSSEVSISGQSADPNAWVGGTIEHSTGDLANLYDITLADGSVVTARSVLDGTPLEVGDGVWLVQGGERPLIVGLH